MAPVIAAAVIAAGFGWPSTLKSTAGSVTTVRLGRTPWDIPTRGRAQQHLPPPPPLPQAATPAPPPAADTRG